MRRLLFAIFLLASPVLAGSTAQRQHIYRSGLFDASCNQLFTIDLANDERTSGTGRYMVLAADATRNQIRQGNFAWSASRDAVVGFTASIDWQAIAVAEEVGTLTIDGWHIADDSGLRVMFEVAVTSSLVPTLLAVDIELEQDTPQQVTYVAPGVGACGGADRRVIYSSGAAGANVGLFQGFTNVTFDNSGDVTVTLGKLVMTDGVVRMERDAITLGLAAITFEASANIMTVTADGLGNVVTSITGGGNGDILVILSGNTGLTIQDTTACACSGDFVSNSADDSLTLMNDGGADWIELSRRDN